MSKNGVPTVKEMDRLVRALAKESEGSGGAMMSFMANGITVRVRKALPSAAPTTAEVQAYAPPSSTAPTQARAHAAPRFVFPRMNKPKLTPAYH